VCFKRTMSSSPTPWNWQTRAFIGLVISVGLIVLCIGVLHASAPDPLQFLAYLVIAIIASSLKVNLPGISGTMSVNFLFILLGVVELGFADTLAIGGAATVAQCLYRDKPRPIQVAFNACSVISACAAAYWAYQLALGRIPHAGIAIALLLAASVFFFMNTAPVALVIALTEKRSPRTIWRETYFWTFPYYLVGAGIAGLVSWLNRIVGWQASMLALPVVYVIYRSYRLYLGKLEDEKRHVEEVANLHMRTIEALALAIEAKDHTTHDHLQRVRVYAVEIAKRLSLEPHEVEAVQAAALLHDIGKLAVPEHIISKPGRLTPEEFEKIKIHPLVGGEILERVQFPYPVVPIVQAHHERYDGTGYPLGLRKEQIPIGARILSAVDFLDALASDRQYRRALPMDEVLQRLHEESGRAFDPQIVKVLEENYVELEKLVVERTRGMKWTRLSVDLKVDADVAPASGFESDVKKPSRGSATKFLQSIAAARQEGQTLFELSQDLGASLSLDETLSVLAVKLKRLVPYDSIAIYLRDDSCLCPRYVSGDNFRLFSSLRIPLGEGVSGWVVQNRKPIVNGNPSVEPGYLDDPTKFSTLRSALSVPLEGVSGVVGALTLYKVEPFAFDSDHLRIVLAVSSKAALSIENALRYQQAESSATTDYLTELPNTRSLFLHLDRELARCRRANVSLTVMVGDLDGFKQVNDRFGHLEGNQVLKLFAKRLRECCREYDYVARMGGDEFVLVFPGLTAEVAATREETLIKIAHEVGQEICGEDMLSLSVGAAAYPKDGQDAEELLAEADRRMYVTKQEHHSRASKAASVAGE